MNMNRRKLLKKINAVKRPERISGENEFRMGTLSLGRKYNPKKLQPRWLSARRREVGLFDSSKVKADKLYKWRKAKAKMNHLVAQTLKQGYVHPDVYQLNGFQEILFSKKLESLKTTGEIIYTDAQKDKEWELSGMATSMKSREGYFTGARGFYIDPTNSQHKLLEPRGYATDGIEGYKTGLIKEDFWVDVSKEDIETAGTEPLTLTTRMLKNRGDSTVQEMEWNFDAVQISPYICTYEPQGDGTTIIGVIVKGLVKQPEDFLKRREELEVLFTRHVALLSRTQRMETKTAVNYTELAAVALSKLYHEGKVELRDYNDINFSLTYDRDLDVLKAICDDERPILPNILHIAREYLDVVKALRSGK